MTRSQRSKNARIWFGPRLSQIACSVGGSSQDAKPFDSAVKPTPALAAWRLAHS
jgi:hypothetical protein